MTGQRIGYRHISAIDQNIARQLEGEMSREDGKQPPVTTNQA
jgi:hypothetical protein